MLSVHLHGLWGVYLTEFFRRIATSLIGLYIPVYIWQEMNGVVYIPIYFLIYSFSALSMEYFGARVIRKIGVDFGMFLGSLFRGGFIVLLIFAKDHHFLFVVSAFFFGIAQPFDWLPYHYVVAKVSKKIKLLGKAASCSIIVTQFAGAIGPVVGGLLIFNFGYSVLYTVAGSFLILAAVMPFLDDFKKSGMHVNVGDVFVSFKDKGILKHFFTYGIRTFDAWVYVIIWPIFLYTVVGSIEGSGILQTLSLVVALAVTFLTGRFVDKNNFKMMKPGSILVSLSWWARVFLKSNFGLFIVNMLYNVGLTILWTPHDALVYSRCVKKYTMEFIMIREIIWYITSIFNVSMIIVMLMVFDDLYIGFWVASIVALLSMKVPYLYKKYINNMSC